VRGGENQLRGLLEKQKRHDQRGVGGERGDEERWEKFFHRAGDVETIVGARIGCNQKCLDETEGGLPMLWIGERKPRRSKAAWKLRNLREPRMSHMES